MKNMHVSTLDAGSYTGPAFKSAPVISKQSRKPRGKGYRKDPGLRHYMVKHPTACFLLSPDLFTYDTAKAEAVRLGGIVTNHSWATAHGCKMGSVSSLEQLPALVSTLGMHDIDDLTRRVSAFTSFEDLLSAAGNYRPSLDVSRPLCLALADAYDSAMVKRNDNRRAYRYGNRN